MQSMWHRRVAILFVYWKFCIRTSKIECKAYTHPMEDERKKDLDPENLATNCRTQSKFQWWHMVTYRILFPSDCWFLKLKTIAISTRSPGIQPIFGPHPVRQLGVPTGVSARRLKETALGHWMASLKPQKKCVFFTQKYGLLWGKWESEYSWEWMGEPV